VAIDIGTGSGSGVLRRAAREPRTLFIALDADASALADGSRRAARPSRRGGLANVMFLAAAAETLPADLRALAHEATVILPWGSLLRATLEPECPTFAGIAAVVKSGGELTVLVSAEQRDNGTKLDASATAQLADRYRRAGCELVEWRPADRKDVERYSSGWGRRLGIPERRDAWLYCLRVR
jgi:16S rRNA (adenine(1408)-N(1))-methyltransferase